MTLVARAVAVVVSTALVVSLAGCTSPGMAEPSAPPTVPEVSEPSDDYAQPATGWPAAEAAKGQLFDGNCENIFDPDELLDTYREGTADHAYLVATDPLFAIVGGINCSYSLGWYDSDADNGGANLLLTVVPAAIADVAAVRASLLRQSCVDGYGANCTTTGIVGEWWYTIWLDGFSTQKVRRANLTAITHDLAVALADVPSRQGPVIVQPFDCRTPETGGLPVTSSRGLAWDSMYGQINGGELAAAALLLAGPVKCEFMLPDNNYWDLTVYPNSADAYLQCAGPSVNPMPVKGVLASTSVSFGDTLRLCATDGTSLITAENPYVGFEDALPSLDALGDLLGSVFGAVAPSSSHPWRAPAVAVPTSTDVHPFAGGECTQLLDPAYLQSTFGLSDDVTSAAQDLIVASVGGLDCVYAVGDLEAGQTPRVRVTIAPTAIVDLEELKHSLVPKDCAGRSTCTTTGTVGGWWYSLEVTDGRSTKSPGQSFDAILRSVQQELSAATAPAQVSGVAPFTCDAVKGANSPVTVQRTMSMHWGAGTQPGAEIFSAAFLLAGPATCTYIASNSGPWAVTVYPGGASIYKACAGPHLWNYFPPAPIWLPGVESAFGHTKTQNGSAFCATDGKSTVEVAGDYQDDWDATSRAEIGALLTAVFAAAG